jgi:Uncharacterized protein conserved in bacteria (DUF2330)
VADESAVIVWDEATKTEHFIRRATFRAQVKDFGFLVPTPSKPELSEARDASFARLEDVIRPEVVQKHGLRIEPTMLLLMFFMRSARSRSDDAVAPVRVLEEKRVAGYDAVVLEADDAGALAAWLKEHGYAQRPALAEWLTPYVQKKWKLTAFKVADGTPGEAPQTLGTNAVRMSFHTDRPFFPYREPPDQRESLPPSASTPRSLRVFFIGTSRASATVGEGTAFAGTTAWAGPFDAARAELPVAAPPGAWLTVFQDDSSPRPGTDELWFDPAKDQTPLKPPPTVVEVGNPIPIPLDLIALVGLVFWRVARRAKKREK